MAYIKQIPRFEVLDNGDITMVNEETKTRYMTFDVEDVSKIKERLEEAVRTAHRKKFAVGAVLHNVVRDGRLVTHNTGFNHLSTSDQSSWTQAFQRLQKLTRQPQAACKCPWCCARENEGGDGGKVE